MARRSQSLHADIPPETPEGSACLPRVVFVLIVLLLGTVAGLEVRNVLRHPSLIRRQSEDGSRLLTFYQKGHASAREAWVFDEPQGAGGPPRLIQRIDCRPQETRIGEVRWTADLEAVCATARPPLKDIRWLFESGAGRLFVGDPDFALPGATAIAETQEALKARWLRHGGQGPPAAVWYDLGNQGPHLFFWQTTRWERQLP
ncbi:MAG: hypothetical protein EOP86_05935 [Verrucomicrobiaceae bacterium]|nr:MAG: hypothetical protein EOP86_05935 [Verrucomicrobiaceae bacterium]